MKKNLFIVAILAIAALTSCQKEQSQLDFNAVQEKAIVQGYVYIDKGYVQEGENYLVKSLPAKDCAVLIKVPYKKYDATASAGEKFFEGVCDENGFYKIEVPVGQSAITGVRVYTRPIVDKYYDMINDIIIEKEVSYPEASAAVEIERGKIFTAANIYLQKDVENPVLTRSQVVEISGLIQEKYEEKEWIDPDNKDKGYIAVQELRNASKVDLTITLTNSEYYTEKIVYNISTNANGEYKLSANLYDTWQFTNTQIAIETKAYKSSITHYYQSWDEISYEWTAQSQSVTGYYPSYSLIDNLSESDLLLGAQMNDVVLTFKPDYNNNTIYGIGEYEIDYVEGTLVYKSWNPLYWNY